MTTGIHPARPPAAPADTVPAGLLRRPASAGLDTGRPALARLVNYWAGGKDHFAVDRTLADQTTRIHPGMPHSYRAARQAAGRAVARLTANGIRQFVDLNPGLPAPDHTDTHLIAQHIAPTSHIVYTDTDPLALAHCRALHTSDPAGTVTVIAADPTQPAHLVAAVTDHFDRTTPVAVLATNLAHHLDDHHLHNLATQLARHLPTGSLLIVTTHTTPADDRLHAAQQHLTQAGIRYHHRNPDRTASLLRSCGLTASTGSPATASTRPTIDDSRRVPIDVQIAQIGILP
ncbi:S-adenosyl methyltransferase [Micromonospora sp. Llam0]|uniref:SAM-dependent methyltransferase n=1 Tax=Micromonospora sp. Llam0 TaxID=2485143 RepID=UPI000F967CBA|nr:SAM-dependent methyltransferase [Micromonospora sp. Llam0]ROO62460.1 S-adenosyl methyltransferase [Micromonospora sp. Llam0]